MNHPTRDSFAALRRFASKIPLQLLLYCSIASVYLIVGKGKVSSADANVMLEVSRSLIERGDATISPERFGKYAVPGRDGKFYSFYGIGKSLANVPFCLLAKLAARVWPRYDEDRYIHFFVSQLNPLLSAGVVVALYTLCICFGLSCRESVWLSALFAFGTIAFPYAKDDMSEPLAALMVTVGVTSTIQLCRNSFKGDALWAATALGGAVATRHVLVLVAFACAALVLWTIVRRRTISKSSTCTFFGVLGLFAAAIACFNFARFGNIFETGYDALGGGVSGMSFLSVRFVKQFFALLLSPGIGLIVYCPPTLLVFFGFAPLLRRYFAEGVLLLSVFLLEFGLAAGYQSFSGGWSWGPRLLLPVLPLLFPFVGYGWARISHHHVLRWVCGIACFCGVFANTGATVTSWHRYLVLASLRTQAGEDRNSLWSISDSQIANQPENAWEVLTLPAEKREQLSYGQTSLKSAMLQSRSLNLPDLWWVRLAYEGVPKMYLSLALFMLLGVCFGSWLLLIGKLRTGSQADLVG